MSYWQYKRAVVVGGSAGLGRALARTLVEHGTRVAIVARGQDALDRAAAELRDFPLPLGEGRGEGQPAARDVAAIAADVTRAADVERLAIEIHERWGGVDLVVHAAGRSMRGDAITTAPEVFQELWELNFLSAVRVAQAFTPDLLHARGHLVLVGSLAGKCAPRFLGAYPASKFPLAALAQQLRMELGPKGVHTLLVSPGPIARPDGGERYTSQAANLPAAANRPGGGARLQAIDPARLSAKILVACEARRPELVVPWKTKLLFSLAQLWPTLGDWVLQKKTSDS